MNIRPTWYICILFLVYIYVYLFDRILHVKNGTCGCSIGWTSRRATEDWRLDRPTDNLVVALAPRHTLPHIHISLWQKQTVGALPRYDAMGRGAVRLQFKKNTPEDKASLNLNLSFLLFFYFFKKKFVLMWCKTIISQHRNKWTN